MYSHNEKSKPEPLTKSEKEHFSKYGKWPCKKYCTPNSLGVFDPRGFSPKNTTGHVTQGHLLDCYETNAKSQYKSHQSNCPIQNDATAPLSETQSSRSKEEEEELGSEKEGSY